VIVSADRLVLPEAITNVIDNAINYSPPGSRIEVRVQRDGGHAVLAVADEGLGSRPNIVSGSSISSIVVDEARSRGIGVSYCYAAQRCCRW
jgi:K+-sensing histidine kinase KdpD